MKVLFIANKSSSHATRWANELHSRGYEIVYVSVIEGNAYLNNEIKYIKLKYGKPLGYLLNKNELIKIINKENPDLIHVHYSSGNGLLASFTDYQPLLLSIYGKDIFDFPYKSQFHKKIMERNINKANWLCSTSHVMARKIQELYGQLDNLTVTPFGVDLEKFQHNRENNCKDNEIVIGTVKKIEHKYGIDTLIKGFSKLLQDDKVKNYDLKLLIVGDGSKLRQMKKLSNELGIKEFVTFVGSISHDRVPEFLNKIDIFAALSRFDSESFGVSIIEASATEAPVIVSNVGGLPEVVDNNETGIIIPKNDPEAAKNAMLKLLLNKDLRRKYGVAGRKKVENLYDWKKNVDLMEEVYQKLI